MHILKPFYKPLPTIFRQIPLNPVYSLAFTILFSCINNRLPTEAEWEYAAGGGSTERTEWAGTENDTENGPNPLSGYAVYRFSYGGSSTQPVKVGRKANRLGLYDMSGNVYEWCWDWYGDYYPNNATTDYRGPDEGSKRVLRGGCYNNTVYYCAVAFRTSVNPSDGNNTTIGFRVARSVRP